MTEAEFTIGRALAPLGTTGSSFEQEQRQLLWQRCRLLFLTGLAIAVVALVVSLFVPAPRPPLESDLFRFGQLSGAAAHAVSFLLALGALYLARGSRRALEGVAFITIAFNLVLAIYNEVAFSPFADPYFAVSLLLFLSAAFVPWCTPYQVALGILAAIWFLLLEALLYYLFPEARAYWAERGGLEVFRNHTLWGFTGNIILGGAAVVVSRTLYNLRKTAHRAKRLGNYLIREELGGGGMGQVFVAQHALLCRPTAVKVMRPDENRNPLALARFEREVKLSSTLTHPNTITIYDVGRTPDNSLYYAMEYLEGLDLSALVERFGPIQPARAVYILKQVCGSLAEAHSRDIMHRDIKPSNIFLTRRGGLYDFVKVLDFGLAKQIGADAASEVTKTGTLFGTPRYLAPETVYGNEKVDGRADIYSLGGAAYWMLTGQPPFTGESSVEVIVDHVKTIPKRPSEVSEIEIPPALEDIVMKCLEKKPADRFQTAWELEAALEAVPFAEPWTREKALEWWSLHAIIGDDALDCECFFPDEELPDQDVASLLAAEPSA